MAEFAKHSIRFLLMKLYKIEGGAPYSPVDSSGAWGYNSKAFELADHCDPEEVWGLGL